MRTALRLNTAAGTEPVTLAEARLQCRIDGTDEDSLLGRLVSAAREYCEKTQGRRYVTQTWDYTLDDFPHGCGWLDLPLGPAAAVSSITYRDTNGDTQTVSTSVYRLLRGDENAPGRVALRNGQAWPGTVSAEGEAVTVTFAVGEAASAVSETVRHQILLLVDYWYSRPEMEGTEPRGFRAAFDALHWINTAPRLA